MCNSRNMETVDLRLLMSNIKSCVLCMIFKFILIKNFIPRSLNILFQSSILKALVPLEPGLVCMSPVKPGRVRMSPVETRWVRSSQDESDRVQKSLFRFGQDQLGRFQMTRDDSERLRANPGKRDRIWILAICVEFVTTQTNKNPPIP